MEVVNLIETMGFPIVAVCCLALFGKDFVTRVMDDNKQRENQLISVNMKLSDALQVVAETTESAVIQLNRLCERIDNLENKVDILENELKK